MIDLPRWTALYLYDVRFLKTSVSVLKSWPFKCLMGKKGSFIVPYQPGTFRSLQRQRSLHCINSSRIKSQYKIST